MFVEFVKKLLKKNERLYQSAKNLKSLMTNSAEASPIVYHCRGWTSNEHVRNFLKKILSPFYILKFLLHRDIPGREGLAVVLIAKNEAPYIEEWINFHHKQGVSHFIIYDNESTDNLRGVLKPYIDSGLVTYHLLKGRRRQNDAYNMAVHDYGCKFKYMAFIDADEFIFVRDENYRDRGFNLYDFIDDFMKSHKNAGGIGINWCIFGSNGHITKPEGGVLENYTMCSEKNFGPNIFVKTICDPMRVFCFTDPHFPNYRRKLRNLDENGGITRSVSSKVSFDKIRINHYFTKSLEEYKAKRIRGKADRDDLRTMDEFYVHDQNLIHDTEILSRL